MDFVLLFVVNEEFGNNWREWEKAQFKKEEEMDLVRSGLGSRRKEGEGGRGECAANNTKKMQCNDGMDGLDANNGEMREMGHRRHSLHPPM